MISPLKFALGLTLFLITIVIGEMLLSGNGGQLVKGGYNKLSKSTHRISYEPVIVVVFAISLAIVILVPAIKGEIFVEWAALKLPNVARLIAAFGLNFFPGYLILAILGRPELGKLPKLIMSYLLSLFVLAITGFVSAHVIGFVDEFCLHAFLLVCAALIIVYLFKHLLPQKSRLRNPRNPDSSSKGSGKTLPNLLLGLAIAFMAIFLWWMYSNVGFFIGPQGSDMWRFHGFAQTFLDYKAFHWLHAFWLFPLYLAVFTVLAGAPSANAYLVLYPLLALPAISFYVMASSFFKDKRIAPLAVLSYVTFSGPAWIYALNLRNFSSVISYDNWIQILWETADKFLKQGRYPPFVVGLNPATIAYTSLWWMLYAAWQLDLKSKFNLFLVSATFAMSYLLHGIDSVIFVGYLSALLLVFVCTQNIEGKKRVRWATVAVLMGLGIVSLIDISLTPQYDYFNDTNWLLALSSRWQYFNSPSFYALIFAAGLLIGLTHTEFLDKKLRQLYGLMYKRLAPKHIGSVKNFSIGIMFNLYSLSLVVFVILLPSLTTLAPAMAMGRVPWYVYPVIGGVVSFFGLVAVAIALHGWKTLEPKVRDTLVFCALSIGLLFILGKITSFINQEFFYTRFWESRILAYIHPVMSMLMAYAIVTLFGRFRAKRPPSMKYAAKIGAVSLITSVVILSGVSSTLMAGDFSSRILFVASLTTEELEALNYLHYSLPEGFKTAYINLRTGKNYIRCFANDKYTYDTNLWLGQYYFSPGSVLSAIDGADIKFLYLNRMRDAEDLEKNLFIQQLVNALPVEFSNSEVTIYSIPPLRRPSGSSSIAIFSPEEIEGESYDAYALWFFSLMMGNLSYSVISDVSDAAVLNATETLIMPHDPLPVEEDVGRIFEWVSEGGHLVLSNTNIYGTFSDMLGLTGARISLVDCDSAENWTAIGKRGTISLETASKVEGVASLRMRNNLSAWERWVYTPPEPWDLSRHEYLGIWVYGTGGSPVWYLYLEDSNGNENYYRYDLSVIDPATETYIPRFIGWKLHLIPIQEYYGDLNLSAIEELNILTGNKLPVNMLIDEIFLMREVGEKPPIVLADGIQGSATIDFPEIEIEGMNRSLGSDIRIIANYTWNGESVTPFAVQRDFGDGKVTYMNINSFYRAILDEQGWLSSPHEVFAQILVVLGVTV